MLRSDAELCLPLRHCESGVLDKVRGLGGRKGKSRKREGAHRWRERLRGLELQLEQLPPSNALLMGQQEKRSLFAFLSDSHPTYFLVWGTPSLVLQRFRFLCQVPLDF